MSPYDDLLILLEMIKTTHTPTRKVKKKLTSHGYLPSPENKKALPFIPCGLTEIQLVEK